MKKYPFRRAKAINLEILWKQNRNYLDVLKRSLNNYLYLGNKQTPQEYKTLMPERYENFNWKIAKESRPLSLLSYDELTRLELMIFKVVTEGIPGDFVEAGVWNGGTGIFMTGLLNALRIEDRTVWLADTFSGIPKSRTVIGDCVDGWKDRWVADYEEVIRNFERYGLKKNVRFIKGHFINTLPKRLVGKKIAVARLDADSYQSTMDALEGLYPMISLGGFVYIDDWHISSCKEAVLDFRRKYSIKEPIDQSMKAMWRIRRPWLGREIKSKKCFQRKLKVLEF